MRVGVVCCTGPLIFYGHHWGCLNNPMFFNLGLCAACWAHFMCHHELWPTSVRHPISFLNSSVGVAGGKHYQKITFSTIFTRGQLWPSGIVVACVCLCVCVYVCVCVRQSWVCPSDNLPPVQGRITKFGPHVQNNLVKIPILLGVHWPWPSRSNLT